MTYDALRTIIRLYRWGKISRCELVAAIILWQRGGSRL